MQSLPLFDTLPPEPTRPPTPREIRKAAEDAAFENADSAFVEAYTAFILDYAETHSKFLAEDAQFAYRERRELPQPREWRSTGAIFVKLRKRNLIKFVFENGIQRFGWSKTRGSNMPLYSKV
jgi:hypothetical protein